LNSSISFSFSRKEELKLGSAEADVVDCIVSEVAGFAGLVDINGDVVEDVDLKELIVCISSEITARPYSSSFLISPIISIVPLVSSSISVRTFAIMSWTPVSDVLDSP